LLEVAMKQRVAWQLLGPVAALLLFAGSFHAAIQGKVSTCWLGAGDWQLREGEKEARLVGFKWNRLDDVPRWKRDCWFVSAPTIKSESGKFLSYDLKGREPSVYLTKDKGDHTRWLFEIVERTRPQDAKSAGKGSGIKEGADGYTFRVLAAEGRFKNWYLAAEDPPKEEKGRKGKEPARRRLTLVRGKKQATVFEYVETVYFAEHK